ncbi:MAG TPA: hypothetical protein PKD37_03965 [Oligoflexia bacterium]|nr:hypothetical protein [Oligoflexia bacterium]HMP27123.1 hypothetical protein [Oligoflexia bacterium]
MSGNDYIVDVKKTEGNNSSIKSRIFNVSTISQINILKALANSSTKSGRRASTMSVVEIAKRSAIGDEKETIRYLYILEGQRLVSPQPPGDFTAKFWAITPQGLDLLKSVVKVAA